MDIGTLDEEDEEKEEDVYLYVQLQLPPGDVTNFLICENIAPNFEDVVMMGAKVSLPTCLSTYSTCWLIFQSIYGSVHLSTFLPIDLSGCIAAI